MHGRGALPPTRTGRLLLSAQHGVGRQARRPQGIEACDGPIVWGIGGGPPLRGPGFKTRCRARIDSSLLNLVNPMPQAIAPAADGNSMHTAFMGPSDPAARVDSRPPAKPVQTGPWGDEMLYTAK